MDESNTNLRAAFAFGMAVVAFAIGIFIIVVQLSNDDQVVAAPAETAVPASTDAPAAS